MLSALDLGLNAANVNPHSDLDAGRKVLGLVKVLAQVSQIHRLVLDKGIAL
jgi:hypothetical protein